MTKIARVNERPDETASCVEDAVASTEDATEPHSLEQMVMTLQRVCTRHRGTRVSVRDILDALGSRSFAPILLAVGLIAITPIDSIPTLPTTFGVIVFLTTGQMLIHRRSLWLPRIIANRTVNADRLNSALLALNPYARWADRWLRRRLTVLTAGASLIVIAACSAILAAMMPLLELVPLVSTIPALAFTAFGIALLVHDGVAALAGFALTGVTLLLVFELVKLPF